jgi:AcrR family transcriptional regulator
MDRQSRKASVRLQLLEASARLIATEGANGLTLRRVADEVGTSTMAIYTNFGGMPELRHAVRREGFVRLAAKLNAVDHTDDPVADLATLGLAYYENATSNPDLYRVMFVEKPLDAADAHIGWDTFEALVAGVQRCIAAGRFRSADAGGRATELWAVAHGLVSLELAQLLEPAQTLNAYGAAAHHLFTAYGDEHDRARQSLADGLRRSGLTVDEPRADAS